MIMPAVAAVLALQLAAGAVVDAAAATEVSGGVAPPANGDAISAALVAVPVLHASPSLRAAIEDERYAAEAGYALRLSGMAEPLALALLHSADAAAEWMAAPQIRLRSRAALQAGELDPLRAQLELVNFGRRTAPDAPLPFFAGSAALTAEATLTRRLVADATVFGGATSVDLGDPASLYQGALALGMRYALTRTDSGRIELSASHVQRGAPTVDDFDAAPALTGRASWERSLGEHLDLDLSAGLIAIWLMREGVWRALSIRPIGDARLRSGLGFAEGRAVSGYASVGVGVAPNVAGGLAESRGQATVGVDAALAPEVAAGISASGFVPMRVTGGAPLSSGPSGQVTARVSWSISDELRLDSSTWLAAMMPNGAPDLPSIGVTLGLSGHIPVWHTGSRPRGTDPRAGRNIGVRGIGAAARPGQQSVEEPPPPPPPDQGQLPPELVPPQVNPPIEPPPPPAPLHLPPPTPPAPAPLGGDGDGDGDGGDGDGDGDGDGGGDGDD